MAKRNEGEANMFNKKGFEYESTGIKSRAEADAIAPITGATVRGMNEHTRLMEPTLEIMKAMKEREAQDRIWKWMMGGMGTVLRGKLRGVSTSTDTPNRRSASSCNAARVKRVVVGAGSIRRSRSLPSWSSPRAAEPNTRGRVTP
jgi:hypothetical protein